MDKYEKYQSDIGEKVPKIILNVFYDLNLEKIKEDKKHGNPDYRVLDSEGNLIAVCEVKSLTERMNGDMDFSIDMDMETMREVMQKKDKSHRSKLRNHHSKAVRQVLVYSSISIVFFVSFDMTDHIDMLTVLNEYKMLYPNAPMADLYILAKVYLNRIPTTEFQITQTIVTAHNTDKGREFAEKYLSLEKALNNTGGLPVTLSIA